MLKHDLTKQLRAADRAWQGQLGRAFLWRALRYVAGALLALFVLDVALHLDARWRLGLAAAFLVLGTAVVGWTFYLSRVRSNSLENTARRLEGRDSSLGSKLINFLQLRGNLGAQPALTRQLGERALADYSERLAPVDFRPLATLPELPRIVRDTLLALGGCGAVLLAAWPISSLEFLRFADPFGDHPPFSLTQIEIAEPTAKGAPVTYNQAVVVRAKTTGHHPEELYLSFYDPARPAQIRTVPMFGKGDAGFMQEIAGVKTDLLIYAHTRDKGSVSKKRLVNVALIPRMERAFVTITPPVYTGLKAAEAPFQFKEVRALEGSEVRFRVRSNRPLSGGSIALQTEHAPAAPVPLTPGAENEVGGAFVAAESGLMKFSLVDVAGNASQQNLSANLGVTHDLPPEIRIETPTTDSFVCEDFKVEARIAATDDYGLKTVRIHRALNDRYASPKTVSYEVGATAATERVDFDIKDLGVQPGDIISFFAEAVDTCPNPHLARTATLHLMVISTDEYNNALRERSDVSDIEGKYSDLLNQFHDLVDEQRAISEKLKELSDKAAKDDLPKDAQEQMDKLLARQSELNQKLADMAARMEKFVRDKPLYDVEQELQQTLTQKAAEIRESLAQSNQSLKEAAEKMAGQKPDGGKPAQTESAETAQNKLNQEKRLQALASLQAQSDKQLEKLDQTHKDTEEKIIPPLKDAEKMNALINDLNRFKQLYETQTAACEQTRPMENATTTTDADALALKQLAATEKQMEQEFGRIAKNLREHALEARELFPKAAESARDFAVGMEHADLRGLANRAASTMLAGQGNDSHQSAEKLRQTMAKFFQDVEQGMGSMCTEMDTHLKLKRDLNPRNTFKQMAQGRKPGMGQGGMGTGQQGQGGLDGYAAGMGQSLGMLGGETFAGQPKEGGSGNNGQANAAGAGKSADPHKGDIRQGMESVNRATGSIQHENTVENYRDAIEAYFNTITR